MVKNARLKVGGGNGQSETYYVKENERMQDDFGKVRIKEWLLITSYEVLPRFLLELENVEALN